MLTLFLFLVNLSLAHGEAPNAPREMNYSLGADLRFFSTSANYLAGGITTEDLPNSGSLTDLRARMVYTQDLDSEKRLYGGFVYSSTESYDGSVTRTNGGFNELLMGGQYWLKLLSFRLAPAFDFVYPLYRVDRGADDALLGEGAMKFRVANWLLWPRGRLIPFLYAGYEYRDEGRAHAIPYSLGIKWKAADFWAQFDFGGYERLFNDSDTQNRNSRDVFLRRVNGGSYRYYAINPSLSEVSASAGYKFGAVTVSIGGAVTVNGSSEAQGFTLFGGLKFSPVPSGTVSESDPFAPFKEVDSGSDENFSDLDPTRPPPESGDAVAPARKGVPVQPSVKLQPKAQPKPKAKPKGSAKPKDRAKPKPKKPKKSDVDKLLDEAEEGLKNL